MLSSIGSSTIYPSPASTGESGAGLEARLARYQQELAACINCDTANTREGRETIQALSGKISAIKARMEALSVERPNAQRAETNPTPSSEIGANRDALATGARDGSAGATGRESDSPLGSRVDVFA